MKVQVLTGPPGAGKNTIAELVARKREKCAVIDVDLVRWMVLNPHKAPWDGEEGKKQRELGIVNACMLARNFVRNGFDVILLDVVSNETAQIYRIELHGLHAKIILLLPSFEEIKVRNTIRPPRLKDEEVEMLYRDQEKLTAYDEKVNNSHMSAEEVANRLL